MGQILGMIRKSPILPLWRKIKKNKAVKECYDYLYNIPWFKVLDQDFPKIYYENARLPVDENKVIIVQPRFERLNDNFKLIYERVKSNPKYRIHIHYLRDVELSRKEYFANCRKLVEDMATAKYVFLDDASRVVSCLELRPETIVTQLWHGCGAFKQFGLSTSDLQFGYGRKNIRKHPFYKNLTHVTVSSPEVIWAYAQAMDIPETRGIIKPVGVSRTDVFFQKEKQDAAMEKLCQIMPSAREKKVILYAPTFRGTVADATGPMVDVAQFAKALGHEYVLLIKQHPFVGRRPEVPKEYAEIFAKDVTEDMAIEELLFVSDICISDYSSLIFEYSLFERPMLFYAFDLTEYFDWRGFYYNYDQLTPGPVLKTNEEMIEYIKNIEDSFDRKQIADFKEKFMSACDGHATDRIMEMVFGE